MIADIMDKHFYVAIKILFSKVINNFILHVEFQFLLILPRKEIDNILSAHFFSGHFFF